jgi:hypothetical protein
MEPAARDLLQVALELPEADREALALALLDSMGDEDPAAVLQAWREEIRCRLVDLDAGRVTPCRGKRHGDESSHGERCAGPRPNNGKMGR